MTVVDVNTGKFTGKGGNLEETVTRNNLEAAEEIVRQLRLRDIGGIIVIDFIDMVLESNRDLVLRRLIECLGRDRTKHQVAEVTSLGLVQMTRKRVGAGPARGVLRALRALQRPRRRSCTWTRSTASRRGGHGRGHGGTGHGGGRGNGGRQRRHGRDEAGADDEQAPRGPADGARADGPAGDEREASPSRRGRRRSGRRSRVTAAYRRPAASARRDAGRGQSRRGPRGDEPPACRQPTVAIEAEPDARGRPSRPREAAAAGPPRPGRRPSRSSRPGARARPVAGGPTTPRPRGARRPDAPEPARRSPRRHAPPQDVAAAKRRSAAGERGGRRPARVAAGRPAARPGPAA